MRRLQCLTLLWRLCRYGWVTTTISSLCRRDCANSSQVMQRNTQEWNHSAAVTGNVSELGLIIGNWSVYWKNQVRVRYNWSPICWIRSLIWTYQFCRLLNSDRRSEPNSVHLIIYTWFISKLVSTVTDRAALKNQLFSAEVSLPDLRLYNTCNMA